MRNLSDAPDVTLISPFVGRITDYWKKEKGVAGFDPEEDPGNLLHNVLLPDLGVVSVRKIYTYYKKYGYNTIGMLLNNLFSHSSDGRFFPLQGPNPCSCWM